MGESSDVDMAGSRVNNARGCASGVRLGPCAACVGLIWLVWPIWPILTLWTLYESSSPQPQFGPPTTVFLISDQSLQSLFYLTADVLLLALCFSSFWTLFRTLRQSVHHVRCA